MPPTVGTLVSSFLLTLLQFSIAVVFGFCLARAISRGTAPWLVFAAATGLLVVGYLVFSGVQTVAQVRAIGAQPVGTLQSSAEGPAFTSTDGAFQISAPGGWEVKTTLHANAALQLGRQGRAQYLVGLTEKRADMPEWTLDRYVQRERDQTQESSADAELSPVSDLQIGNWPAKQWTLNKTVDGVPMGFVCTVIMTDTHFFYIEESAAKTEFDETQPLFAKIAASFQELKPGPALPAAPANSSGK
jgi:hypothetical protein